MKPLFCLFALATLSHAGEYYVSSTASTGGAGTYANPWRMEDLAANPQPSAITNDVVANTSPTVWIKGGTYGGLYTFRLIGSSTAPVIVKSVPGEAVIFDTCNMVVAATSQFYIYPTSHDVRFLGPFTLTNSCPNRTATVVGAFVTPMTTSFTNEGYNILFANFLVHDGLGVFSWANTNNTSVELYGWITSNLGWDGPEDIKGHCLYAQNNVGTLKITDGAWFNCITASSQIYGSSVAYVNNINITGNWISGPSSWGKVGVDNSQENWRIADNVLYYNNEVNGMNRNLHYQAKHLSNMVFTGNIIYNHNVVFAYWTPIEITNNVFFPHYNNPAFSGNKSSLLFYDHPR